MCHYPADKRQSQLFHIHTLGFFSPATPMSLVQLRKVTFKAHSLECCSRNRDSSPALITPGSALHPARGGKETGWRRIPLPCPHCCKADKLQSQLFIAHIFGSAPMQPCHQSQLYCAAQVRYRICSPVLMNSESGLPPAKGDEG